MTRFSLLEEDLQIELGADAQDGERMPLIVQLRKQICIKEGEIRDLQDKSEYDKAKLRNLERHLLD